MHPPRRLARSIHLSILFIRLRSLERTILRSLCLSARLLLLHRALGSSALAIITAAVALIAGSSCLSVFDLLLLLLSPALPKQVHPLARQPQCVQRRRRRRLVLESERPLRKEEEVVGRRRL